MDLFHWMIILYHHYLRAATSHRNTARVYRWYVLPSENIECVSTRMPNVLVYVTICAHVNIKVSAILRYNCKSFEQPFLHQWNNWIPWLFIKFWLVIYSQKNTQNSVNEGMFIKCEWSMKRAIATGRSLGVDHATEKQHHQQHPVARS